METELKALKRAEECEAHLLIFFSPKDDAEALIDYRDLSNTRNDFWSLAFKI